MKTAVLYAGQGSQHTGMGKDLYDNNQSFREALDEIEEKAGLDFDLKKLMFTGPDDLLSRTEYTQPCIVAFQAAINKELMEKGFFSKVSYLAGLSLGEYSALNASGVWSYSDTVRIAAFRGKAMTAAAKDLDFAMAAVIGLDRDNLEKILIEKNRDKKELGAFICNDNCPGQLVVSGERSVVEEVSKSAKENGAMKSVLLNVSGPFHTPYMKSAGDALSDYIPTTNPGEMHIPVVFNCLGSARSNEDLTDLLVRQVQTGVRMRESIQYMILNGTDNFIEVGPGRVISGFVKRTVRDMQKKGLLPDGISSSDIHISCIETSRELENLITE